MLVDFENRRKREEELCRAIETGSIQVWYQPIVSMRTGAIESVEALARLQDGTGTFIGPDVFIPLAERYGCVQALGGQVLAKSCQEAKSWIEKGKVQRFAVNLSAVQLQDPLICAETLEIARRFRLAARTSNA